jgi:hypothetical protein
VIWSQGCGVRRNSPARGRGPAALATALACLGASPIASAAQPEAASTPAVQIGVVELPPVVQQTTEAVETVTAQLAPPPPAAPPAAPPPIHLPPVSVPPVSAPANPGPTGPSTAPLTPPAGGSPASEGEMDAAAAPGPEAGSPPEGEATGPPASGGAPGHRSHPPASATAGPEPAAGPLGFFRPRGLRSLFAAVAPDQRWLTGTFGEWDEAAARLIAAASGADPASDSTASVADAERASSPGAAASSHFPTLGPWFLVDPPLPLSLFYALLAAATLAVWIVLRRELGLPAFSKRRRL